MVEIKCMRSGDCFIMYEDVASVILDVRSTLSMVDARFRDYIRANGNYDINIDRDGTDGYLISFAFEREKETGLYTKFKCVVLHDYIESRYVFLELENVLTEVVKIIS